MRTSIGVRIGLMKRFAAGGCVINGLKDRRKHDPQPGQFANGWVRVLMGLRERLFRGERLLVKRSKLLSSEQMIDA